MPNLDFAPNADKPRCVTPEDGQNVSFAAIESPFRTHRSRREFPPGLSIAHMMAAVGMPPGAPARVFLNDRLVGDDERGIVPRPGQIVTVRAIPAGHGKNPLEIVLEIAVAAAATYVSGGALGPAFADIFGSQSFLGTTLATTFAAHTFASIVAGAAVGVIGRAEIQSLFPSSGKTSLPKIESTPASYSISGNENILAPFSPMPKVYGQRRIYPMLAAPSFNESGGNSHNELYTNEYLRMLFVLGYGPLDITQIKIGDTLLSDYEDVEWEVRAGYPDDAPPSLYTGAVMETSFNIQLVKSANPPQTLGWQTQTTGEGADECGALPLGAGCGRAYHARPRIRRVTALASPRLACREPLSTRLLTCSKRLVAARASDSPARTGYDTSVALTARSNCATNRFGRWGAAANGATVSALPATVTVSIGAASGNPGRNFQLRLVELPTRPLLALRALLRTRLFARLWQGVVPLALEGPPDPRHQPGVTLALGGDHVLDPLCGRFASCDHEQRDHAEHRDTGPVGVAAIHSGVFQCPR